MRPPAYVGIDVAKQSFDVAIRPRTRPLAPVSAHCCPSQYDQVEDRVSPGIRTAGKPARSARFAINVCGR